jgi:hypothetical protein
MATFRSDFLFQLTADEKTEQPIGFLTHEDKKTPKASTLTKGRMAL